MVVPPPAALKGRRLELRTLGEADAEALSAAIEASREHLKRRLRWAVRPQTVEDCRSFIVSAGAQAERGEGLVRGVFEQRKGELVGLVALQRMLETPGTAEFSGWVRVDRRDKGYAFEAGKVFIAHAFKKDGLNRIYARIDPANRAGRKVLQKLGFRYEGCLRQAKRLNNRWIDQECWGLLKSEWKKAA